MSQANETEPGPGLSEQLALLHLEQEIDSICDSFESAWRSGRHPELAEYLNQTKLPASTLFVELVQIDLDYRRRSGEKITIEEYVERYPQFSDALSQLMPALETVSMPMPVERRPVVLGRFELVSMLGEGTFGVVWKARDTKLRQWVAIKRFRETMLARNRELFAREARAVARLNHPNVVRLLELSQGALTDYIVFEFVEGKNLKKVLSDRRGKPLEPEKAARIALQLAEGLAHVHEAGFIHRDFKPANVILAPDGTAKILDFGLAKHAEATSTITAADGLLGTIPYMSPEQCEESPVGPATDIYSLGAVLYEMLSGRRPFEGTPKEMVAKIPKGGAPDFEAPAPLKAIVRRAMEIDPLDRYPTARDLANDLQRHMGGNRIETPPIDVGRRVRKLVQRREFLAAAGAATAALSTYAFFPARPEIPDGKQAVRITTEPPGAKVHFIPLDKDNGRPLAAQGQVAPTISPTESRLLPGDYLVVAYFENEPGRFHEAFRHVPKNPDTKIGLYRHQRWERQRDAVELPAVQIPIQDPSTTMVSVDAGTYRRPAARLEWAVPAFSIDPTELTVGAYREQKRRDALPVPEVSSNPSLIRNAPDDFAVNLTYDQAIGCAEIRGKRLIHELEFTRLVSDGGLRQAFDQSIGPVGPIGNDRIDQLGQPIWGLRSNVAEWVESWELTGACLWTDNGLPQPPEFANRVILGARPGSEAPQRSAAVAAASRAMHSRYDAASGIGVRFGRSAKPRILPEDFVHEATTRDDHGNDGKAASQ